MCVVSMVGDHFSDAWKHITFTPPYDGPSRQEFNDLCREVQELKKLLLAAKEFDEKTGQPDCEMDEKVETLRRVAKFVGVDLDEVFGNPAP